MPATLKQIAEKCGVSLPVVSAVLNKKSRNSRVGEETRKRIEQIADQLNYLPNVTAQNLREKKTNIINVVIPSFRFFEVEGNTHTVNSLQTSLNKAGYSLQVTSLDWAFKDQKLIKHIHTDGIILFYWGLKHDLVAELNKLEVPVLVLNGKYDGGQASNLYIDHRSGMYDLAKKVVEAGHTRIAYINTYPGNINHQEMFGGLEEAAGRFGGVSLENIRILPDPAININTEQGAQMGRKGLDMALALDSQPTVVMFNEDLIAMAAVKRAHKLGLRVPEDISITGAGDSRYAEVCETALTTTENKAWEEGLKAAEVTLEMIRSGRSMTKQVIIPVKAVIRESLKKI